MEDWIMPEMVRPNDMEIVVVACIAIESKESLYSFAQFRQVEGTDGEWHTSCSVPVKIVYWSRMKPLPEILHEAKGEA